MAGDFSQGAAFIDGTIVPVGEAKISVMDWGLTHSDITYDVVPVIDGGFFRLPDYLARFQASLAALFLDIPQDSEDIRAILHSIVVKAGLRDSYCAMVASRGVPIIPGSRDPRECANHFFAWAVPYIHVVKPDVIARGARLWISKETRRIPEDSVNPRAKNYHWGDFTQGIFEAKRAGFDNVALLDHDGNVTEGPGFNVFAVTANRLVTSDHGVLHGISRKTVLELAREQGLNVETRPLPLQELLDADEVFLSSSGGGVLPIAQVDDRIYQNASIGPVSEALNAAYWARTKEPAYREEIVYNG